MYDSSSFGKPSIETSSKIINAHYVRAKAYICKGQIQEALDDLTYTMENHFYNAETYLLRAYCHQALGNKDIANEDMAKAEELDPNIKYKLKQILNLK